MNPEITETGIRIGGTVIWPEHSDEAVSVWTLPGGYIIRADRIKSDADLLRWVRNYHPDAFLVVRTWTERDAELPIPTEHGSFVIASTEDDGSRRPFALLDTTSPYKWRDLTIEQSPSGHRTWYAADELVDWLPARLDTVRDLIA
jgi:hypothetical protein